MTGHKRGRPFVEIDEKRLAAYCECGATNRELAALFNCSERTIESRRKSEAFRDIMDRAEALGNVSLRRKQMSLALNGNVPMLIWLGKNRLEQKDKTEHSGEVTTTPPKIHVHFVAPQPKKQTDGESK